MNLLLSVIALTIAFVYAIVNMDRHRHKDLSLKSERESKQRKRDKEMRELRELRGREEQHRLEQEAEKRRLAQEAEKRRLEAEEAEKRRLAQEAEKRRLAKEAEELRLAREKADREAKRRLAEEIERLRLAKDAEEKERLRLAKDAEEKERLRLAKDAEELRLAREKADREAERRLAEEIERLRSEREKAEQDKRDAERRAAEKRAEEEAERRLAEEVLRRLAEEAEQERRDAERRASEKRAAERRAAEARKREDKMRQEQQRLLEEKRRREAAKHNIKFSVHDSGGSVIDTSTYTVNYDVEMYQNVTLAPALNDTGDLVTKRRNDNVEFIANVRSKKGDNKEYGCVTFVKPGTYNSDVGANGYPHIGQPDAHVVPYFWGSRVKQYKGANTIFVQIDGTGVSASDNLKTLTFVMGQVKSMNADKGWDFVVGGTLDLSPNEVKDALVKANVKWSQYNIPTLKKDAWTKIKLHLITNLEISDYEYASFRGRDVIRCTITLPVTV